tara:strand:- start:11 stop:388 length:378 start_codon:yes stop_codon:yes gene_type:complete
MFNYTLCIPRVCKTVTKNTIYDVLNNYKFGKIKKVQIIENKNKNCNIIHIHYCYWFNNEYVNGVKDKLLNNLNIKIFYDQPWFWVVYLHKEKPKDHNHNSYKTKQLKSNKSTTKKWSNSKLKKSF